MPKPKSYDNMANAINKRLVSLAKQYGIEHPAYKSYLSKLDLDRVPMRRNSEGIPQIKRGGSPNKYQQARVKNLYKKGQTVSEVRRRYAKKHPEVKGRKNIDKAIKQGYDRQREINETLDNIYKYFDTGILPEDLVEKYNNFKAHDTSNEEIDAMMLEMRAFDALVPKIYELNDAVNERSYVPEEIEATLWSIMSGRLTLSEVRDGMREIQYWLANGEGMAGDEED